MPSVMLAAFALCGLVGGFGVFMICSYALPSRGTAAAAAVLACLLIFGGTTMGFARAVGKPVLPLSSWTQE